MTRDATQVDRSRPPRELARFRREFERHLGPTLDCLGPAMAAVGEAARKTRRRQSPPAQGPLARTFALLRRPRSFQTLSTTASGPDSPTPLPPISSASPENPAAKEFIATLVPPIPTRGLLGSDGEEAD